MKYLFKEIYYRLFFIFLGYFISVFIIYIYSEDYLYYLNPFEFLFFNSFLEIFWFCFYGCLGLTLIFFFFYFVFLVYDFLIGGLYLFEKRNCRKYFFFLCFFIYYVGYLVSFIVIPKSLCFFIEVKLSFSCFLVSGLSFLLYIYYFLFSVFILFFLVGLGISIFLFGYNLKWDLVYIRKMWYILFYFVCLIFSPPDLIVSCLFFGGGLVLFECFLLYYLYIKFR